MHPNPASAPQVTPAAPEGPSAGRASPQLPRRATLERDAKLGLLLPPPLPWPPPPGPTHTAPRSLPCQRPHRVACGGPGFFPPPPRTPSPASRSPNRLRPGNTAAPGARAPRATSGAPAHPPKFTATAALLLPLPSPPPAAPGARMRRPGKRTGRRQAQAHPVGRTHRERAPGGRQISFAPSPSGVSFIKLVAAVQSVIALPPGACVVCDPGSAAGRAPRSPLPSRSLSAPRLGAHATCPVRQRRTACGIPALGEAPSLSGSAPALRDRRGKPGSPGAAFP